MNNMENKIELYLCSECETMTNKPYGKDEVLCEKCWDEALCRAEFAYDQWKDEQMLKEFN